MINVNQSSLSSFLTELLANGRTVFTVEEAEKSLGINRGAFLDAAERLQKKNLLKKPRRGFYVAVPPQFSSWEGPPPDWYIDEMMKYEGVSYYIALLKAAEFYGATHQAVMEYQVVTEKRMPNIHVGRNLIAFYYRKDIEVVKSGLERHKTDTGLMQVSSPSLTGLDMLRYKQASAGIDNIVTVLSDLGQRMKSKPLAKLSNHFEMPVVQRLGYLLDSLNYKSLTKQMHAELSNRGNMQWIELDRSEIIDQDFKKDPISKDQRWRVIIRREPEIDE